MKLHRIPTSSWMIVHYMGYQCSNHMMIEESIWLMIWCYHIPLAKYHVNMCKYNQMLLNHEILSMLQQISVDMMMKMMMLVTMNSIPTISHAMSWIENDFWTLVDTLTWLALMMFQDSLWWCQHILINTLMIQDNTIELSTCRQVLLQLSLVQTIMHRHLDLMSCCCWLIESHHCNIVTNRITLIDWYRIRDSNRMIQWDCQLSQQNNWHDAIL